MKRSPISRADLLDALVLAEHGGNLSTALLGFERPPVVQVPPEPLHDNRKHETRPPEPPKKPEPAKPPVEYPVPQPGQRALKFLLPVEKEVLQPEPLAPEQRLPALTDDEISMPNAGKAELVPLAPWSRLAPFLRRRLGRMVASHRLDWRLLVRHFSTGLPWRRLPRLIRPSWGTAGMVLWDTSPEMEPYQPDATELVRRLKRERGRSGLQVCPTFGPPTALPVVPGVPVLILSPLGQLQSAEDIRNGWLACGRQLQAAGHRLTALVPGSAARWHPAVAACIPSAPWDRWQRLPRRGSLPGAAPAAGSPRPAPRPADPELLTLLLDLLAPASYITPGLLRRVRLLLGPAADAALEHAAWFHPDTTGSESGRYFGFREGPAYTERLTRLRQRAADPATQHLVQQAAAIIRADHQRHGSPLVTLAAELRLALGNDSVPEDLGPAIRLLGQAVERLRELAATPGSQAGYRSGLPAWFCRFVEQGLTPELRAAPAIAELVAQGLALARKFLDDLAAAWPTGLAVPAALAELRRHNDFRRRPARYRVDADPAGLRFCSDSAVPAKLPIARFLAGEPLAHLLAGTGPDSTAVPVRLESATGLPGELPSTVVIESDWERVRLETKARPFWANRWFRDRSGVTAEVELPDGAHRFHWGAKVRFQLAAGVDLVLDEAEADRMVTGIRPFEWLPVSKPTWASRLWADEFGVAAEFTVNGVAFVLRWIPPGRFLMGSPEDEVGRFNDEGPQHEVTITRGFWLGETPVTQAQWQAVVEGDYAHNMLSAIARLQIGEMKRGVPPTDTPDNAPVTLVDWPNAQKYCRLLNAHLFEGPGFRLPSEAQWEYACRAGTTGAFHDGSGCTEPEGKDPALDQLAWFGGNSDGRIHPVKQKQANEWGLHDMHGNVWEWCADAWSRYAAEPQADPFRDGTAKARRVVRGGSWVDLARHCRAAFRYVRHPGFRLHDQGFRLAAGLELQAAERPPGRKGGAGAEGGK